MRARERSFLMMRTRIRKAYRVVLLSLIVYTILSYQLSVGCVIAVSLAVLGIILNERRIYENKGRDCKSKVRLSR